MKKYWIKAGAICMAAMVMLSGCGGNDNAAIEDSSQNSIIVEANEDSSGNKKNSKDESSDKKENSGSKKENSSKKDNDSSTEDSKKDDSKSEDSKAKSSTKTDSTGQNEDKEKTSGSSTNNTSSNNKPNSSNSSNNNKPSSSTGSSSNNKPSGSTGSSNSNKPSGNTGSSKPSGNTGSSKPSGNTGNTGNTSKPTEPAKPAHTHSYTASVVAPTCTSGGYTVHTCSCGNSYTDSETPATGHSWGGWYTLVEATTASGGTEQRACSVCGATEERATDPLPVTEYYLTQADIDEVLSRVIAMGQGYGLTYYPQVTNGETWDSPTAVYDICKSREEIINELVIYTEGAFTLMINDGCTGFGVGFKGPGETITGAYYEVYVYWV